MTRFGQEVVEKARWEFTVALRKGGYFDTTIGECPVEAFRDAMRHALTAACAIMQYPSAEMIGAARAEVGRYDGRGFRAMLSRLLVEIQPEHE